jgi:hypothetical protein
MRKRFFLFLVLFMTGCGWERFYYPMDSLEPNDDSINATTLLPGNTLKASIHPKDWADFCKFDVVAGEKIRFVFDETSNKNVSTRVELLDSMNANEFTFGRELTQHSDTVVVEFTRSQTYFLRVSGGAASWEGIIVGFNDEFTQLEYSLRLERNPTQSARIKF